MTLTEGLLIVIVIILTVLVLTGHGKHKSGAARSWDCVDRETGEVTSVKMQYNSGQPPGKANLEKRTTVEHAEYFDTCKPDVGSTMDCLCDGDDKFQYAINEFGGPGMEYKDYVTAQSIDPQVVKNHSEFVKDRIDKGALWTGRTYTPEMRSEMEGSDSVPWMGIRGRATNVAVCDPTQVADYNENSYVNKKKLTWSST